MQLEIWLESEIEGARSDLHAAEARYQGFY